MRGGAGIGILTRVSVSVFVGTDDPCMSASELKQYGSGGGFTLWACRVTRVARGGSVGFGDPGHEIWVASLRLSHVKTELVF